jgi:hypothetical protein
MGISLSLPDTARTKSALQYILHVPTDINKWFITNHGLSLTTMALPHLLPPLGPVSPPASVTQSAACWA